MEEEICAVEFGFKFTCSCNYSCLTFSLLDDFRFQYSKLFLTFFLCFHDSAVLFLLLFLFSLSNFFIAKFYFYILVVYSYSPIRVSTSPFSTNIFIPFLYMR